MTDTPSDSPRDPAERGRKLDFLRQIVTDDRAAGKHGGRVHTRFPPEPNGYLHIGHAKAICLDFGIAQEFGGKCNLRLDDTNPAKEETEYVDAIAEDIRWLGFDWEDRRFFASDYFPTLYEYGQRLIQSGDAFVCSLEPEQVREYRGTVTTPGRESPDRARPVEESLELFARMKAGEFPDGAYTLRAKIDMAHPNMHMRDPAIYRIRHLHHHRTGDAWCIYPMYDFAHCASDSIEGITHSFCTLEFEEHRPLYDWFLEKLGVHRPQQIEFARLNLSYLVLSKRRLVELVEGRLVSGWDDPRIPTLAGMRRRGYTPAAIRTLCEKVGISKMNSVNEYALLESCVREDLNKVATRGMAVLDPIKLVVTDWPEGKTIQCTAINNPEDPDAGERTIPFSGSAWIEREDFLEDPPGKWFRLAPGKEVRLMHNHTVTCEAVVKDDSGRVTELHCTHDPDTLGKNPEGRKVKGVIHWVPLETAVDAEVRLYDHLFTAEDPGKPPTPEGSWLDNVNPDSLQVATGAKVEPSLAAMAPEAHLQFVRTGYFCADRKDHVPGSKPVFNRTVGLRDSWGKAQKGGGQPVQKGKGQKRSGKPGGGKQQQGQPKQGKQ